MAAGNAGSGMNRLIFPTDVHRDFVQYLQTVWGPDGVAMVKGSLAKGTAREHSDVDVILHGDGLIASFGDIVTGFDRVLLSEHFTGYSTYYVVYENGLTVEYDLRNTVSGTDMAKGVFITDGQPVISTVEKDRIRLDCAAVPYRRPAYSKMVICQMCLLKLLCGKQQLALDIFTDRMKLLGIHVLPAGPADLLQRIRRILEENGSSVSAGALEYLHSLLAKAARLPDGY